ncbi:hypothetical protein AB7M17_006017 [Bradyrhizobium sp. USDA 377]
MTKIPLRVVGTTAPILGEWYSHAQLNALFQAAGFPANPPPGNKSEKCRLWLLHANEELPDALAAFGKLIQEMMDSSWTPVTRIDWNTQEEVTEPDPRDKIRQALAEEGLSYREGGYIYGASLAAPSRDLAELLKDNSIQAVEKEFNRAYRSIEADPPAAITAACAILEAVCKHYLEIEGLPLPTKQVLSPLWSNVAKNLGLSPELADDDVKQILSGLFSIANGVAALRTHESSAHGRGSSASGIEARHARLAVHAAHTMALFILDTWEARKGGWQIGF